MASTERLIRIVLRLEDQMTSQLNSASGSLKNIGSQMQSLGTTMTASITAPVVAAGAAMFKTFADFESVMVELEARTQSTSAEMEAMQQMAIEMGRDTVFSATEAAEAMLELTSSGSSAAEAMEQLPAVLDLAAAGALDLGTAADGVTDVLAMFQLEATDAADVVDALARAAGSSSATVGDLTDAFGNVGPVAAQFGLTVDETAAALAVFAENGIKGAESGTQLRSMLLNMTRDTASVQAAWDELGVSLFDAQGNMRDLDTVFNEIATAMEDLPMEDQIRLSQDIAGSYGLIGFNALTASGGIGDMANSMASAASASEVADARMNTLQGRWNSFMGSLETLAIVLGGLGEGPLTDFLLMATNVVNAIATWAQENPKLAQTIMAVVAAIATIGPVLVILGTVVSAIGTLVSAFSAIGTAVTVIGPAMATLIPILWGILAPIAPLLIALGLLAAALVWADQTNTWETWQTNGRMLGQIFQLLGQRASEAASAFGDKFRDGFNRATDFFSNFRQNVTRLLGQLLAAIVQKAREIMPALQEVGKNIMQGLIEGVKGLIQGFIDMIGNMAKGAIDAVKNAFGIASPSKVMAEMGNNIVAGFNQGIAAAGGLRIPTPGATSGRAPTVGQSRGFSSNQGGGNGLNINNMTVNVPAGTTQQQVDAIARELGKRTNRRSGI